MKNCRAGGGDNGVDVRLLADCHRERAVRIDDAAVQKIFYYHFPVRMALTVPVTICTAASAVTCSRGRHALTALPWPPRK
jgi:hypothetical protein